MTRQSLCDITTDNSCPHCKQTQKHLMFERVRRLHFERQVKIEMDRNAKLMERIRELESNLNSEKKKNIDDKANKFPLTVSTTPPTIPKLQISEKILEIGATGTKLNPLSDICHGILTDDEFASPRTATSISNLESPFSTAIGGNISFAQIDASATAAHWILDRILSLYRRERDETFKNIADVTGYAEMILQLCKQTREKLAHAPLFLTLHSPLYILGDLHGNFKALEFFITHLIKFGLPTYTGSRLLFLGDYVDRGDASVEVAAVLLALKCLAPDNVILLRGNHETAECLNSRSYGKWGFSSQCRQRFGKHMGRRVFMAFAEVFTHLPLAASVDGAVFCVHAGIPRPEQNETYSTCMNRIKSQFFPRLLSLSSSDTDPPELLRDKRLVSGLLWADPAPTSTLLDDQGFGPNPLRGEGSYSFGTSALDNFLSQTGFQCVVRGHQCVQTGLRLGMGGRVVTVFTSSAYCGQSNAAGALYVTQGKLRLVTCRPSCENAKPDVEGTDDLSHKIPGQEEGEEGLV